ncbi:hypothetical protein Dimus_025797 [Dionaea muscipula]
MMSGASTSATSKSTIFLSILSESSSFSHLKQIHAQIILNGLISRLQTVTKLTQKLCDIGAVDHASLLVSTTPNPDIFIYNALIKGFSRNNLPSSSLWVYTHLRKYINLKPNNHTYGFAISAAGSMGHEKVGVLLHAHSIVDGSESNLFVGSAIINMYVGLSEVESAYKVFDKIPERDTVLWNTMISGFARNEYYGESLREFWGMIRAGAGFDSFTLASVLPAAAELLQLEAGMAIQCMALKSGVHDHIQVLTGLVSLYAKCGDLDAARLLFGQIGRPDLICYNAMISGCTCNNETEFAVRLFTDLLISGEKVNSSTLVGLLPVSSPFGYVKLVSCVHGFCVKTGLIKTSSVATAVATVYSRQNELELARQLFDESSEKSLALWNAMISGYAQQGVNEKAISLFQEMESSGVHPNPVTVTSILSSCAQLGALSVGIWVHEIIGKQRLQSNIYVSTALIDMYAKCGSIIKARELFDKMPEKNVVSWNAMISGYGLHGYGQEAVRLFNEMLNLSISPSEITFLCVLYACSHAGLVTEGKRIFLSMVQDHSLRPLTEHYACMVDLFGRAGQLEKALDFIEKMPVEPGPQVWGSLLGACLIHKAADLARIASVRLQQLDPESIGHYVSLSNIYTADRKYREAASVRRVAKNRRLAKAPGCTLIEVGEMSHIFTSGDKSHPQAAAIYARLEMLMVKMKEAGYQAQTSTTLHDVEEEEKELMVNVHSEKLAIAFALISTKPGSEIRIFKNLRVCVDCHNATKFISKITERVVVVRDANRFHHFQEGVCSCGDYWTDIERV